MGNHTINRSLRYLKEHYTSHAYRSRQQRYRGCADQRPNPGGAPAKCSVDRVLRFESPSALSAREDVSAARKSFLERGKCCSIPNEAERSQVCRVVVREKY